MPICYLHAGTHKTGTTALQRMLLLNETALAQAGVFVPKTGRTSPEFAAHHAIAWELNESEHFRPGLGSLQELVEEVVSSRASTVCVSSEDFEQLYRKPAALAKFRDAFASAGYRVKVIVYLRPQAEYFEAIYADAIRSGAVFRFEWLMLDVFQTGAYCSLSNDRLTFEYSKLLDGFANVFGTGNIIAKRFLRDAHPARIVRDFLGTIGASAHISPKRVQIPPRLNVSLTFGDLLKALSRNYNAHGRERLAYREGRAFDHPSDFIHYAEAREFFRRFGADSRIVRKRYGVRVPPVDFRAYATDVLAKLGLAPASRERRRALDDMAPWLEFFPVRE